MVAALVLAAASAGAIVRYDPYGVVEKIRPSTANAAGPPAAPPATATVREGPLSSQINADGTLTYTANSDGTEYSVANQAGGVYTDLPSGGDVIECGQVLYLVDNRPIVLLCGSTPAYRSLVENETGPDIAQLNDNLVRLGYASKANLDPHSDTFGAQTSTAVKRLQKKLGVPQSGAIALGDFVYLPGPIRISKLTVHTGAGAQPAEQVLTATSTQREVQVDLDASQQTGVSVGDKAQVTLPDQTTTPAVVARIGTVAESAADVPGSSGDSSASSPDSGATAIPVYFRLERPKDAGSLEQAPVRVQVTTGGVEHALIVPVTALIGRPGGGFAVETVAGNGVRKTVPVTLGLFDDADGLVQVKGALASGDRVVVPAT
ncbi:hypothetical protein GCM10027569_65470 [Flindersiella endophytica]